MSNELKKRGRPRAFDEDEALLSAVHAFWTKGYDGTSMKNLINAMGISGPSLYAAFGGKRELYLKAIERYANVDGCGPVVAFETEPNIQKAVKGFLRSVIMHATSHESGARGCFLASCVATNAGEVEGVQERLLNAIVETDVRLAKRFDQEKRKGTLPKDFPSRERARLMYDMRQGYVLRGRAGQTTASLKKDLEYRVKIILLH